MPFSDLALSRRLERAEGHACKQFAVARRKLFPHHGADWMEQAGANVVFDGVDSPVTQTFGLGLFEPLTEASLDTIETFFRDRGAPTNHEISPLVGLAALSLLCDRGYRPIEISSVMHRALIGIGQAPPPSTIKVRLTGPEEAPLWSEISARGWTHEHPELMPFLQQFGELAAAKEGCACFLAELDGQPAAAGALNIHHGVALFTGASTIPEFRRRGLQSALLQERMRYAADQGCDLAMMVAEAGSNSQRNAERQAFQIAYTRIKWRLAK